MVCISEKRKQQSKQIEEQWGTEKKEINKKEIKADLKGFVAFTKSVRL